MSLFNRVFHMCGNLGWETEILNRREWLGFPGALLLRGLTIPQERD